MATVFAAARLVGVGSEGRGVVARGELRAEGGRITHIGESVPRGPGDAVIDLAGRVLMPAFVDAHTHACWAGSRLGEWAEKMSGVPYLEILARGGGIMSTVRAVRAASETELAELLLARLERAESTGTLAIEVKSGYGLSTRDELKMLGAICAAASRWRGVVVPTACIGHALDPDVERGEFVRRTLDETLPAVSSAFPGVAIDGYCERGAWSLEESVRLAARAMELGHPVRMHADQFSSMGFVEWAAGGGVVRSVDHLEASSPELLAALGRSGVVAVVLPVSGLHLDDRYANGRAVLEAGGRVVVATNWNPGSSPCGSVAMAMAVAVRKCGLSVAEAIAGTTAWAADLLGLGDRGRLAPGCVADVMELHGRDERELAFELGGNPVRRVFVGSELA